jgi:hypothetical protein
LRSSENDAIRLVAAAEHRMGYQRIDRDRGFDQAGRPAEVWSSADSRVAKLNQAVQYRRD